MDSANRRFVRCTRLILLLLIAIPGVRLRAESASQAAANPLQVIQSAPEFSLENVLGGQVHSRDLKGKVVVVEFWATWAIPSRSAMLEYTLLRNRLKDQGVEFLAVTFESGTVTEVSQVVRDLQIEFPVVMATTEVDQAFGGHRGFPTTFLVGKDWKVYRRILGQTPNKTQTIERDVLSLLAIPSSEPEVPPAR